MRRWLPWLLVLAAGAAVAFLALPMLEGSRPAPGSPDLRGDAATAKETEGATLRGTGEAGPGTSASDARYRVLGRVIDEEGHPAAGVRVTIERGAHVEGKAGWLRWYLQRVVTGDSDPVEQVGEATSAADGSFSFALAEGGSLRVFAKPDPPRCGSRSSVWVSDEQTGAKVTLHVTAGVSLAGRVVDEAGHGVAAQVSASLAVQNVWYQTRPVTAAAADGTFHLFGMPAGTWRLAISIPPRLQLAGIEVQVPRDGEFVYRLGEGTGGVGGRVTNESGAAVAHAEVLVQTTAVEAGGASPSASERAATDADGRYEVRGVVAGRISMVGVEADGLLPYLETPPRAPWSGAAVKAGERTEIDIVLRAGAAVTGRVFDEKTNAGLSGADVRAFSARGYGGRRWGGETDLAATTDASGHYRIEGLVAGTYLLVAHHATHYLPGLFAPRTIQVHRPGLVAQVNVPPPTLEVVISGGTKQVERDLAMRAGCSVHGTVLGPDDQPVEGARLRSGDAALGNAVANLGYDAGNDLWTLGTTDASGRFEMHDLPARPGLVLVATHEGYVAGASDSLALDASSEPPAIEIHLGHGATILGRYLDANGQGAEGEVYAYATQYEGVFTSGPREATDADGSFRLEDVPPGTVRLSAWGSAGSLQLLVEKLQPGETREGVVLQVAAGVRVSGVVVDPDGAPVPGRNLTLTPSGDPNGGANRSATTDAQGRFTFENAPAGKVQIQVSELSEEGYGQNVNLGPAFEAPADDVRLVYTPVPKLDVSGRVLDPRGAPVPICRVTIEASGSRRQNYGWNGYRGGDEVVDGTFRRRVDGTFPISVTVSEARDAAGAPLNVRGQTTRVEDAAGLPVTIRLESGLEVTGRVLGPSGQGVPEVVVQSTGQRAWTDADGRFTLPGVDDGADTLEVSAPEDYVQPQNIALTAGQRTVEIRLERALAISGSVEGPDGKPVTSCWVQARWHRRDEKEEKFLGAQVEGGRFEVRGLPEGAVARLEVQTWGTTSLRKVIDDVTAGTTGLVIRLDAGVSIRGRVVRSDGNPASGGYVRLWPEGKQDSDTSWAQIQSDGTFEAEGLVPGAYRLLPRTESGLEAAEGTLVAAPAEDVRLVLPESRSIRGRLTGAPDLQGYSVWASTADAPSGSRHATSSGADGTFTIDGVADGTYVLRARASKGDGYGVVKTVRAGASDVEIPLQRGLAIEGTALAPNGEPIEDGWVMAQDDGWTGQAKVDHGAFRIGGLPPGRYRLTVYQKVGTTYETAKDVSEADAGATSVRLRMP